MKSPVEVKADDAAVRRASDRRLRFLRRYSRIVMWAWSLAIPVLVVLGLWLDWRFIVLVVFGAWVRHMASTRAQMADAELHRRAVEFVDNEMVWLKDTLDEAVGLLDDPDMGSAIWGAQADEVVATFQRWVNGEAR